MTPRIMLACPIRQKPEILKPFLDSITRLKTEFDCVFIDDNTNPDSSNLLKTFECKVFTPEIKDEGNYQHDNFTHKWDDSSIWKVAMFKDFLIEEAINGFYDYIFFIDSDLILHPETINQLISRKVDIISNIFWTSWQPNTKPMPNVWQSDEYNMFVNKSNPGKESQEFLEQITKPGYYEVGGLGACTLISRAAIVNGCRFAKIPNITFWGEDRHFCVRANALGFKLHVETTYPAYHIYRDSDLDGITNFINPIQPSITLSMIVKNESLRYLAVVLESVKNQITNAVIIDDGSSDSTVSMIAGILRDIPYSIIHNNNSKFSNEIELRKQQWEETIKVNPEWILTIDADEIVDGDIINLVRNTNKNALYFRLFDMWSRSEYRSDNYWKAHQYYRPFLIKYDPNIQYIWKETAQHCGRHPININQLEYELSNNVNIKHYGWSQREDREKKYQRYKELDPESKFGWKEQYESIMDENPNLVVYQK